MRSIPRKFVAKQNGKPPFSSTNGEVKVSDILDTPTDNFCVVCCYFNPVNWTSLRTNYLRFLRDMQEWNVPVFNVEVAYKTQKFLTDAFIKARADEENILWQKERLINMAVEQLPARFSKIAWIDADVLMLDRYWVPLTCFALEKFKTVQLWGNWYHSDRQGSLSEVFGCVGHLGNDYMTKQGHPGGAWAATRDVFPLYEHHILGGGDSVCLEAWVGMSDTFSMRQMSPAFGRHWRKWAESARQKVQGSVTYLPGGAIHLYHGSRKNRNYGNRWKFLGDYDPAKDVEVGPNGLLRFTDSATFDLKENVKLYFTLREEDDGIDRNLPSDWFDSSITSQLENAKADGIRITTVPKGEQC